MHINIFDEYSTSVNDSPCTIICGIVIVYAPFVLYSHSNLVSTKIGSKNRNVLGPKVSQCFSLEILGNPVDLLGNVHNYRLLHLLMNTTYIYNFILY